MQYYASFIKCQRPHELRSVHYYFLFHSVPGVVFHKKQHYCIKPVLSGFLFVLSGCDVTVWNVTAPVLPPIAAFLAVVLTSTQHSPLHIFILKQSTYYLPNGISWVLWTYNVVKQELFRFLTSKRHVQPPFWKTSEIRPMRDALSSHLATFDKSTGVKAENRTVYWFHYFIPLSGPGPLLSRNKMCRPPIIL